MKTIVWVQKGAAPLSKLVQILNKT